MIALEIQRSQRQKVLEAALFAAKQRHNPVQYLVGNF